MKKYQKENYLTNRYTNETLPLGGGGGNDLEDGGPDHDKNKESHQPGIKSRGIAFAARLAPLGYFFIKQLRLVQRLAVHHESCRLGGA